VVDLVEPRSSQYARDVQARALTALLRDKAVRVVAPEDFIVLKLLATRERDLEDASDEKPARPTGYGSDRNIAQDSVYRDLGLRLYDSLGLC